MDLAPFVEAVGTEGPVGVEGLGTRGGAPVGVRVVRAPSGVTVVQAEEMTISCGAGTPVDEVSQALADVGQRVALPEGGTVGGALAVGRSSIRRLGDGPLRDVLLQARYVSADGHLVTAGGPTVKNVSGFDLCRLLVGSQGTLGFIGDVILRTRPLAAASQWFCAHCDDPRPLQRLVYRPVSMLWNGRRLWVLLEGHPRDVADQAARHKLEAVEGPPPLPPRRFAVAPSAVPALVGDFIAEVGVGVVHSNDVPPEPQRQTAASSVERRLKTAFDPCGRLNPR
jgi:glycolate oxidase FAD binding subunit